MLDAKINNPIYYPLLASEEISGGVQSVVERKAVWTSFDDLPEMQKEILSSEEMAAKLWKLQQSFGLDETAIESIAVFIRWFFFRELDESGLRESLQELLGEKANEIFSFIQKEAFTIKPKPKVIVQEEGVKNMTGKAVRLPLLKAMAQYENLGYQLVTNEKIKVKGQPEPQRPSLANWIRYYRDELGVGFHEQVLRGRFLFQSENGKRLSNEERERINLILKSIEEDFPLDIDVEQGVIIFPTRSAAPTPKAPVATKPLFPPQENAVPARTVKPYVPTGAMNPASGVGTASATPQSKPSFFASKLSPAKNVAGETLHFSTGHVLPGEKAGAQPNNQSAPATPAQAAATPQVSAQPTSPTSASPTVPFRSSGINQNRGAALPRSPYSIRPLRLRDDVGAKEE